MTDGPFAETKETLGGYYLLDVANLDDAIEAAGRCPGAQTGTIEVRPIADVTFHAVRGEPVIGRGRRTRRSAGSRDGRSPP